MAKTKSNNRRAKTSTRRRRGGMGMFGNLGEKLKHAAKNVATDAAKKVTSGIEAEGHNMARQGIDVARSRMDSMTGHPTAGPTAGRGGRRRRGSRKTKRSMKSKKAKKSKKSRKTRRGRRRH